MGVGGGQCLMTNFSTLIYEMYASRAHLEKGVLKPTIIIIMKTPKEWLPRLPHKPKPSNGAKDW